MGKKHRSVCKYNDVLSKISHRNVKSFISVGIMWIASLLAIARPKAVAIYDLHPIHKGGIITIKRHEFVVVTAFYNFSVVYKEDYV